MAEYKYMQVKQEVGLGDAASTGGIAVNGLLLNNLGREYGYVTEEAMSCSSSELTIEEGGDLPCEIILEDGSNDGFYGGIKAENALSIRGKNSAASSVYQDGVSYDEEYSSDSHCSLSVLYPDGSTIYRHPSQLEYEVFQNDLRKLPSQNRELLAFLYQTVNTSFSTISKYIVSRYSLSYAEINAIRKLRRQIKNRMYAKNCRKRKMENIRNLAQELSFIRTKKERLLTENKLLRAKKCAVRDRCNALNSHIHNVLTDRWRKADINLLDDDMSDEEVDCKFQQLVDEKHALEQKKQDLVSAYNQLYTHTFKVLSDRNGLGADYNRQNTVQGGSRVHAITSQIPVENLSKSPMTVDQLMRVNGAYKEQAATDGDNEEEFDDTTDEDDDDEDSDEDTENEFDNHEEEKKERQRIEERRNDLIKEKNALTEKKTKIETKYLELYKHTFRSFGSENSAKLLQLYMSYCIQLLNIPGLNVLEDTSSSLSGSASSVQTLSVASNTLGKF